MCQRKADRQALSTVLSQQKLISALETSLAETKQQVKRLEEELSELNAVHIGTVSTLNKLKTIAIGSSAVSAESEDRVTMSHMQWQVLAEDANLQALSSSSSSQESKDGSRSVERSFESRGTAPPGMEQIISSPNLGEEDQSPSLLTAADMNAFRSLAKHNIQHYVSSIPTPSEAAVAAHRKKDIAVGDDGGTALIVSALIRSSPESLSSRSAQFNQGVESSKVLAEEAFNRNNSRNPEMVNRATQSHSHSNPEIATQRPALQLMMPHDEQSYPPTNPVSESAVGLLPGVMQHFDERRAYYSSIVPLLEPSRLRSSVPEYLTAQHFSVCRPSDVAVSLHDPYPTVETQSDWMQYIPPIPNMNMVIGRSRDTSTHQDRLARLSRSMTLYPNRTQQPQQASQQQHIPNPIRSSPTSYLQTTKPTTPTSMYSTYSTQYSVNHINPIHQRRPAVNPTLTSWTQYQYS